MVDTPDYSFKSDDNKEANLSSKVSWFNFWRSFIYLTLLSLGGGISYSWYFLTQKMVPMLEKPVSNFLSRPIKLGEIQAVSFTSIRLGESYLPTTEVENDSVIAQTVEISINPWQLLNKKVELTIDINQAQGYLQQDDSNGWLKLNLNSSPKTDNQWRVKVREIAVEDSNLFIKSNQREKINEFSPSLTQVEIPRSNITFSPQEYLFNIQGNLANGGKIKGSGLYKTENKHWLIKLNSQELSTDNVNQIVRLPVNLDSGKVSGDFVVGFAKSKLDLDSLQGNLDFTGVNLNIAQLPQSLTNSRGKISFQERNILLKDVKTNFGLIDAEAEGSINNYQTLDIQAKSENPLSIDNVLQSLKLDKINIPTEGKVSSQLNIAGAIKNPLVTVDIVNEGKVIIDKIPVDKISGDLSIINRRLNLDKVEILPSIGGKIKAQGNISLDRQKSDFNINWQGENIETTKVISLYEQSLSLPVALGKTTGNYDLKGDWQKIEQTQLTGEAKVELPSGEAKINQIEIKNKRWTGRVNLSSLQLKDLPSVNCEKIDCQESFLSGDFQVTGETNNVSLDNLDLAGNFHVDLPQGRVTLQNTKINNKNWQAVVQVDNFNVSDWPSINLSSLPVNEGIKLTASLDAQGSLKQIDEVELNGRGSLQIPQGQITITDFSLRQNNFTASTLTKKLPLAEFNPNLTGEAEGEVTIAGNINNLQPQSLKIDGDITLTKGISFIKQPLDIAFGWDGHKINVKQASIDRNIQARGVINYDLNNSIITNINLDVIAQQVDLQRLSLPSSNFLNYQGEVNFSGKLTGNATSPQLQGELGVNQLRVANLAFSSLQGKLRAHPIEGISLNLDSNNGSEKLSLQLDNNYEPQEIYLQHRQTKIQGEKQAENLALNLENIPLNQVVQPWLTYLPQSVQEIAGNLSGEVDVALSNYDMTRANIIVSQPRINHLQGDTLVAELISNGGIFTITRGNLVHQDNKYDFTGELRPFVANPQLQANVEIANGNIQSLLTSLQFFEFGDIQQGFQPKKYATAEDLYSSMTNDDDQSLSPSQTTPSSLVNPPNTDISQSTSPKVISSSTDSPKQKSLPTDSSIIETEKAPFPSKSITSANQPKQADKSPNVSPQSLTPKEKKRISLFPLATFNEADKKNISSQKRIKIETKSSSTSSNTSKNISPSNPRQKPLVSIKNTGDSLLETLDFFNEIEQKMNQKSLNEEKTTIPPLEEFNGDFQGNINLTASVDTGITAEFDFQGNSWQWGKYEGDLLQLTGSYNNGLLTFLPVTIKSEESVLSLTGTFKPERISGDISLSNFPLSQLKPFLNIPPSFDIEGNINATIAVSGSEEKPQAKGNIEIVDSKINGNKIKKTEASFGLRNSRIDFLASSKLSDEVDYYTLIAGIPFQLFPNSNKPSNTNFNINFNLKKEGFSLLSIITDNQLNWLEGEGKIDLQIQGKYNQNRNEITQIETEGIADFKNGVLNGTALNEESITNINGQILFDFAQINVPNISGDFSGGQISLSGSLPLINNNNNDRSLNLLVDDIALNLEDLYQGNLQGNIAITGSTIEPEIGGKIKLVNGEIKIAKKENNQLQSPGINNSFNDIKLNDLSLVLEDNIHIVQPLLLKLRAEGELNLNGDVNNLSPEGIVQLKSGTVNLFTSQLKLVENRENTAKFTTQNGFNPYLDLQLESSATETSRYQLPDNSNPNEIQDFSNFPVNTSQTIRIKASVKGRSDNLLNNIELSSSPSRDQTEIVALLGGGFNNSIASRNSELNLVNLASAAVLGSVQGEIQKAFGFDELRLFPAQILDPEERTSSFGLGAELALDVTDNFSFSVTKILTNEEAPRYSIRYRLNDDTILRGSSDFENDSRGIIEFQKRF